jgi:hypothetical protein
MFELKNEQENQSKKLILFNAVHYVESTQNLVQ